jgi:hypothetical protein
MISMLIIITPTNASSDNLTNILLWHAAYDSRIITPTNASSDNIITISAYRHLRHDSFLVFESAPITFSKPNYFHGSTNLDNCIMLQEDYHVKWEDNSTIVEHGNLDYGITRIMFGSQAPQWTYVCEYNDRDYLLTADFMLVLQDGTASSYITNPFTGLEMEYTPAIRLSSLNPFEAMEAENPYRLFTLDTKTDDGLYTILAEYVNAIVADMEFLPYDDILKIKLYGIQSDSVFIFIDIPKELAVFDQEKYDGSILVNDIITEISYTEPIFVNEIDVKNRKGSWFRFVDVYPEDRYSDVKYEFFPHGKYGQERIGDNIFRPVIEAKISMLDHTSQNLSEEELRKKDEMRKNAPAYAENFPQLYSEELDKIPNMNKDKLRKKTITWYTELYGDWYLDNYGIMPEPDRIHQHIVVDSSINEPKLVEYHDVVLDIEIPLIIRDKDTAYMSSYPEIGWCREPLILVAKTINNSVPSACVSPNTAPELVKRGWAQHTPQISQKLQDKFEDELALTNLVYMYGNAKPMDSFRASIFGVPHTDDIEIIGNISPRPSNNHTLQEILSSELLDVIKPPYPDAVVRHHDILGNTTYSKEKQKDKCDFHITESCSFSDTIKEYQDTHNVCKDGYDYYVKEPSSPDEKRLVIIQFNC